MENYTVLARKYRPQTFTEVIGQEHVTRTLANAIECGRLAHAFLFVGPRGTGKTSTARILAKTLNCKAGPTVNPCGQCPSCIEIAGGQCLDVIEIDGASNNGVEQVRELRENARFMPARDRFKIYIIDEVHMLSTSAFNALLKTLEEPPAHVKFIFATTEAHKVPSTILSRCQRFDLRKIPTASIAEHLLKIAQLEKIDLQPDGARTIAQVAEGGLRDAESMLDQLAAFCGGSISAQDVAEVFGLASHEHIEKLTQTIFDQEPEQCLRLLAELAERGRDLTRLLDDIIQHLRDVLMAQMSLSQLVELDPSRQKSLEQQAQSISTERLIWLVEHFSATEGRMKWATNKQLQLEVAILHAMHRLGQVTLDEALHQVLGDAVPTKPAKAAEPKPPRNNTPLQAPSKVASISLPDESEKPPVTLAQKPTEEALPLPGARALTAVATERDAINPAAPVTPVAPPVTPVTPASPVDLTKIDPSVAWTKLCQIMRTKHPLLAELAESGQSLGWNEQNILVIELPKRDKLTLQKLLNTQGELEKDASQLLGAPVRLQIQAAEQEPEVAVKRGLDPESEAKSFDSDPLVEMALKIFEGTLISKT